MNKPRRSFLITLLIHLVILFLFIFTSFKKIKHFVSLRPKTALQTPTNVFFEKEPPKPKPKPKMAKTTPPKIKEPETKHQELAELRPTKPTEQKPKDAKTIPFKFEPKTTPPIQKVKSETPKEKPIEETSQKPTVRPKTLTTEPLPLLETPRPIKLPKLRPIKRLTEEEIKKAALKNLLKPRTIKTADAPEEAKKSIFSQTKLLIESNDNGNSVISRRGNPNLAPRLEEMKFICYEQNIVSHLLNEWKYLFAVAEKMRLSRTIRPAAFTFDILEDGSIDGLELIESSGSPIFDKMVIKCVKNAAPFPSIPKHLGVKRYRPRNLSIVVP